MIGLHRCEGWSAPLLFAYNTVEFLDIRCCKFSILGRYKFSHKRDPFLNIFFYHWYYTQPPSGTISLTLDMFLLCVCEQLCNLASLCGCAGSSEHSLVACPRGTIISWTGSFHWQPNVKHDAEACKNQFISWFVRLCDDLQEHLMCLIHNTISWGRRARLCLIKSSIKNTMYRVNFLCLLRARFGELRKTIKLV